MTAAAMTLLRWTGAALNASAALLLFFLILTILSKGAGEGWPEDAPVGPVLPFAPGADLLPIL